MESRPDLEPDKIERGRRKLRFQEKSESFEDFHRILRIKNRSLAVKDGIYMRILKNTPNIIVKITRSMKLYRQRRET